MIKVFAEGHDYYYEVSDILANYVRRNEIEFVKCRLPAENRDVFVHSIKRADSSGIKLECSITGGGRSVCEPDLFEPVKDKEDGYTARKLYKRYVKHNMLKAAERFFDKSLPWGILTGIRPVKMIHKLMDEGLSQQYIFRHLVEFYRLSPERARLGIDIALTERKFIIPYDRKKVSVYISIPFCPTRCSYCSFTSNEMSRWGRFADQYTECITDEIKATAAALNDNGFLCDTVYVGGGTPTALNLSQLKKILGNIRRHLVSPETREFTVEAGRPDTLDKDKLEAIKEYGANRIGINPQTMNTKTLGIIGRKHSPADTLSAFETARRAGHNNINMDIIVGLPGENTDMVEYTLSEITGLKPEGVTVHTLAVKRASRLREESFDRRPVPEQEAEAMMKLSQRRIVDMGMKPYYLYRQKYMVGNLENIGYSLPGFEGIYNMQIMEEKQTIIGIGAGAVTKLVFHEEDRLERKQNPKSLEHYLKRSRRIAVEKSKILSNI
jgi:oxygen-independent coproporphyrinogen-3 oxidase